MHLETCTSQAPLLKTFNSSIAFSARETTFAKTRLPNPVKGVNQLKTS